MRSVCSAAQITYNLAFKAELHARSLKSELRSRRLATECEHHSVIDFYRVVRESDLASIIVAQVNPAQLGSKAELNASFALKLHDLVGALAIKPAERDRAHSNSDLMVRAVQKAGAFKRNIATANNKRLARAAFHPEEIVGCDT
jgi:hypothetical protein